MRDVPSYDEKPKEKKTLDVYPLKKGKRTLVYLSDLVISFFLSFLIFTFVAIPISESVTGLKGRQNESHAARVERNNVLAGNKLLFLKYEDQTLEEAMTYTGEQYFRYYSDSAVSVSNPDIFRNFYFTVRNYEDKYIDAVKKSDVGGFFTIDEATKVITLKAEYKDEFHDGFLPGNELTGKGKTDYNNVYSTFFYNIYGLMLRDIQENDLTYTGLRSYLTCQNVINNYEKFFNTVAVIDVYSSFVLSCVIYYLIVPMFTPRHKTVAMLLIKVERAEKDTLELLTKKNIVFSFFYNMIFNLWTVFFVPIMGVGLVATFELPSIFAISLISLFFVLISLIVMLFDQYNRPLSDQLIHCVSLDTSTLEDIYRVRGYDL